ncbi:MAG: META domain-containing protein [Acidimicrobiia bacterium]|nr:META domain-containing protein [Acidimicrobiia bacterium]
MRSNMTSRLCRGSVALAAVTFALAVTACGADSGSRGTPGSGDGTTDSEPTPLEGTPWTLDNASLPTTSNAVITAEFSGGQITGTSGCNRYTASYRTSGSDLSLNGPPAATAMACAPPLAEAEAAFLAKLVEVDSFEISGSDLHLRDAGGTAILSFRATDTSLTGTWTVTSYRSGDAVVGGQITATITFGSAGEVSGNSGCNDFAGTYTSEGATISITGLTATSANACTPELTQQETELFAALQGATQVESAGTQTTLRMADGSIAAILVAAGEPE